MKKKKRMMEKEEEREEVEEGAMLMKEVRSLDLFVGPFVVVK